MCPIQTNGRQRERVVWLLLFWSYVGFEVGVRQLQSVDLNVSLEDDPLEAVSVLVPNFSAFFGLLWSLMCSNDVKLARKIEKETLAHRLA
jgi:hypothetical protein